MIIGKKWNIASLLKWQEMKYLIPVNQTMITNRPCHKKTRLRGFRPSEFQTGLLSYRDLLENWNLANSKSRYDTS